MNLGSLTALATQNVNVPSQIVASQVEGKDCIRLFLFLPVSGSLTPNLQEAVDRALAQAPRANALSNAALYQDFSTTIVVTDVCFRVKGDAVKLAPPATPGP